METIRGKITGYIDDNFIALAKHNNAQHLVGRDVDIRIPDKRPLSEEQRKKAYALLGEIADWSGFTKDEAKKGTKVFFCKKQDEEMFSLSDCNMTLAREFITFLVDFVIEHGVPTKKPLKTLCDDVERYVYACLMHKKCAVCGRKAELHHVDVVGMGRNRDTIYQIGMKVLPLCREHHTIAHNSSLIEDEHLIPIPLTWEIGKVYGLTRKNLIG